MILNVQNGNVEQFPKIIISVFLLQNDIAECGRICVHVQCTKRLFVSSFLSNNKMLYGKIINTVPINKTLNAEIIGNCTTVAKNSF